MSRFRLRELWQLTAAGQAAHDSIIRVVGAAQRSGSLQRTLFRGIRQVRAAVESVSIGSVAAISGKQARDGYVDHFDASTMLARSLLSGSC